MPTITVERLRSDGPFRPGVMYAVAAAESDEQLHGVVLESVPTGPRHIRVTVELSEAEYERLTVPGR